MICSSTCSGSGPYCTPPVGRRRSPPLEARAVPGRLSVEDPGETSESDDVLGFNPGLMGKGPGPDGG